MRVHSADALLLEVGDLSDGDRVVSFLTAEHGRRRGAARGAKRKYSRFSGQLQPLATVRLTWFEKDDRDLVRIRDLEVLHSGERLRRSLEDLLLCAYLTEHVSVFAQENDPGPELFRLLRSVVDALEEGAAREPVLRYFESWILRIGGVLGYELDCPLCSRVLEARAVLPDSGESLLCPECAAGGGGLVVGQGTLDLLRRTRRQCPSRFASGVLAGGAELAGATAQLEELLLQIRRRFLGFELKSHGVIRETLRRLQAVEKGA